MSVCLCIGVAKSAQGRAAVYKPQTMYGHDDPTAVRFWERSSIQAGRFPSRKSIDGDCFKLGTLAGCCERGQESNQSEQRSRSDRFPMASLFFSWFPMVSYIFPMFFVVVAGIG